MTRTRAELLEQLHEQRAFLRSSAAAYDAGFAAEAKRLATAVRVLVHDTATSNSLLSQLDVKSQMAFISTLEEEAPGTRNLTPATGMLILEHTAKGGRYVPSLHEGGTTRLVAFERWWREPLLSAPITPWNRCDVMRFLANKEGGTHVDPKTSSKYVSLASRNELGWMSAGGGRPLAPLGGNPVAVLMRQMVYELELSLERAFSCD